MIAPAKEEEEDENSALPNDTIGEPSGGGGGGGGGGEVVVVLLQVIVAGMALFVKATIGHKGMKPSIFVVYRQAFATLFMALFVLFLESKKTAQLSFSLLCKIFLVSLFGITLTFNLYAYGLKYASATMAAASSNMVLVITFVLAVILRYILN
ncbi:hypothetical protein LguiB_010097 [Lonicera macranthoides]